MCDRRLWFVFIIFFIITGVISWRLFVLQVAEGGSWKAQARGQQSIFEQVQGERGSIYITGINDNLIPVAVNKTKHYAYISPRELRGREESKEDLAVLFSDILGIEKEFVMERIERDSSYEILKKDLEVEDIKKIREKSGIHEGRKIVREYPENDLAAHIIGFLGGQGKGQYGVEQYYNETIGGKVGIREGIRSGWGSFITSDSTQSGDDIILTIDHNIQYFVERTLKEAVENLNGTGGTVIVGDPSDGRIIAMANYPSFDVNNYSKEDQSIFKNSAVQKTYEPGSVFKPITMSIALEKEAVSPEDTYQDIGKKQIHGRVIRNYDRRSYGLVTMTEILEKSINTGIVYVKDQVGNETFLEYLYRFKFFEKTGIDLHGEIYSPNRSFLEGRDANFATASYGHGIEITPIQLFRAFCVLANGGEMIEPYVVKKEEEETHFRERVISPQAALLTTEMMVSTIEQGFGSEANVPGYHIAGKTGTAQIPWSKLGINKAGYSNKTIQGFVGYAPAFDPRFVMVVKIDQPYTRSAGASAAPVFKKIAEYIFEYKKIPHDYIIPTEEN